MGSFFGSIHVRTSDRESVRAAVSAVCKSKKCQALLAPTLRGWTTVYPSMHGQDDSVSRALARRLSADIVHVVVHDDSVFAYFIFRAGKLLDQYNSTPDYFEEVSARKKAKLAGNPNRYADLLKDPDALDGLRGLLKEEPVPTFATESLLRFASYLDLPNPATSYEYLVDGETDDIERFEDFDRVPELSEQDRLELEAVERVTKACSELHDAGTLLGELSSWKDGQFDVSPLWCPAPDEGFLLCWGTVESGRPDVPVLRWTAPWSGPPTPTTIHLNAKVHTMSVSPSGEYLAVGFAAGQWATQVWSLRTETLIGEFPAAHIARPLRFAPDGHTLLFRTHNQLGLIDCTACKQIGTISMPGEGVFAIHPDGNHLVGSHPEGLTIIEIPSGNVVNTLCIGDAIDVSGIQAAVVGLLCKQFGHSKKTTQRMTKVLERLGPEDGKEYRKTLDDFQESVDSGRFPGLTDYHRQSAERLSHLVFRADGTELFVATDKGARVYAWSELLTARDCTPAPRLFADAQAVATEPSSLPAFEFNHTYTYGLLHDESTDTLLYAGLEGQIRALCLADGQVIDVTPRVNLGAIGSLQRSADNRFMCTDHLPPFRSHNIEQHRKLCVWDYARLLESAGLVT